MVYAIGMQGSPAVKIGYTAVDPQGRLAALQTGCPCPLELLAVWEGDQGAEEAIHDVLTRCGAHIRGEWFNLPHDPVRQTDGWEAARFALAFYKLLVDKVGGWDAIFDKLRARMA